MYEIVLCILVCLDIYGSCHSKGLHDNDIIYMVFVSLYTRSDPKTLENSNSTHNHSQLSFPHHSTLNLSTLNFFVCFPKSNTKNVSNNDTLVLNFKVQKIKNYVEIVFFLKLSVIKFYLIKSNGNSKN